MNEPRIGLICHLQAWTEDQGTNNCTALNVKGGEEKQWIYKQLQVSMERIRDCVKCYQLQVWTEYYGQCKMLMLQESMDEG